MSVADDLRAAKALIADRENWIKDYWADDSRTPHCFCAWGAVTWIADGCNFTDEGRARQDEAITLLESHLPEGAGGLVNFNDLVSTTHVDIISLFDRAIAAAEAPNA